MPFATDAYHLVEAPAVSPLPFGLFSVVEPRLETDPHWRAGIRWQTQACSPTATDVGPCIEPREGPLTPDSYCDVVEYDAFAVYAYNDDPVPGYTLVEHEGHARQRLVNGEQYAAEAHLWGLITAAVPAPTDLSAYHHGVVLGYVEQILADNYFGQGVLHMSRQTATILWEYLDVVGGRLQTRLGTPVISGGGYDTLGAPDSEFYIFGTGPVVLYRGDVDTRSNAVDRAVNKVSIIAQRDYVLGWDCFAGGAKGALPTA